MNSETVTEAPAIAPSVELPPAALRIENLEFDPLGNPYYKFPPFLSPPDGVNLIPFHKFKPRGIQISLDSDQEELDGEGIPTAELSSKHQLENKDDKKKKKRKTKKDTDEPKKFSPWWDDWAEGEDLRKANIYDQNVPRSERFAQGAADFQHGRRFLPAIQSLYDHFRRFSGLLAAPNNAKYGKGNGDEADDEMDDDDADFNDDAITSKGAENYSAPIEVDQDDDTYPTEVVEEEKDLRMDMFLNNPEASVKVFFSSFYKDKGLMWSIPKLRDGPLLISFFLAFFVRNHIMSDYTREFTKARKIAELARIELPQTTKISMSLPDFFGRACTAVWGTGKPSWSDVELEALEIDTTAPADTPIALETVVVPEPDPIPEPKAELGQDWQVELEKRGMTQVEVDLAAPDAAPNGWGASVSEDTEGGWGKNVEETGGAEKIGEWGSTNPWSPEENRADWSSGEPAPAMIQLLGPTTIPLTHSIQRAEKSTRQIVAFAPPRADATGLERVLGTVVLAPWKKYPAGTFIQRPNMLKDNGVGEAFDPQRDLIRAFVAPEAVEALREGMSLYGLFVQVLQDEETDAPKAKKPKSRSKTKGKAKAADDKEWWYIEFVYEVIPSFWEEEVDLK